MTRQLASEWLKLRTTRTAVIYLLVAVAVTALVAGLQAAFGDLATEEDARFAISNAQVVTLFALLLGIVNMSGEHRHGTITSTVLAAPGRDVVVVKAAAHAAAGVALGTVCALLSMAVILPATEDTSGLAIGQLALMVIGQAAAGGLSAALGVGVGALIRNQAAAIVAVLVFLFVVEPTAAFFADEVARFGLNGATTATAVPEQEALEGSDLLPQGVAALVLGGWALLFTGLGLLAQRGRDVS